MANVQSVEYTTSGYIEVYGPDGAYISRHRLIDEARESALTHALEAGYASGGYEYTFVSPNSRMSIEIGEAPVVVDPVDPPVDPDPVDPDPVDPVDPVEPDPVDPPPVNPGETPYPLYETDDQGRGQIPFAVNWPLPPQTLREVDVTNNTELNVALSRPGSLIRVAAGSYGLLNITTDDTHIIAAPGAVFAGVRIGHLSGSVLPRRVIIDGGQSVSLGSDIYLSIGSDLLVRNVNWRYRSIVLGSGTGSLRYDRAAFVRNTLFAYKGTLLTNNSRENGLAHNQDLIIAGNWFGGGMDPASLSGAGIEFGLRLMGNDRVIVVDNRGRNGYTGYAWKNAYRIQDGNQNVWFRNNMTEYGDAIRIAGVDTPDQYQGAMWIYDHESYIPNVGQSGFPGLFSLRQSVNASTYFAPLVTDGNVGYDFRQTGEVSPGRWVWAAQPGDSIGRDIELPYQNPPVSWPIAGGVEPGAGHGPGIPSAP